MMPSLLRNVPRVEDLELHELEQLMAPMDEKEKKVLDRGNQIRKSSANPSCDFLVVVGFFL